MAADRLHHASARSIADNGSVLFHITIGERDAWGRGLGTETTQLMLAHAFERLALHRVGLTVFSYNTRAIRAYEKAGFRIEGRLRDAITRDGHYFDEVQMGILAGEWLAATLRQRDRDTRIERVDEAVAADERRPRRRRRGAARLPRDLSSARVTLRTTRARRMERLESALSQGALMRTPRSDETLADLRLVLDQGDGDKLGGKSAEAARFITRRLGNSSTTPRRPTAKPAAAGATNMSDHS